MKKKKNTELENPTENEIKADSEKELKTEVDPEIKPEEKTEDAKKDTDKNQKKNKSKNVKKIILLILASVVAILLVWGIIRGIDLYLTWKNPPVPDNQKEEVPVYQLDTGEEVTIDASLLDPEITLPEPQLEDLRTNDNVNKDEMFNFLLIGRDQSADNTDVMMLMSFNVKEKTIAIMQIPRDTYIRLNYATYKINGLYKVFYDEAVNKKEKDPESYALQQLTSVIENNMCIRIHYNVMINLEGFRNVVDILGGVEVDIPADMHYYDDTQDLTIDLKKGVQVLDGKKAEQFIRYRSGWLQADIGRLDAQKIFMSALLKEVKDHFNITTVIQIATQVFKHVKTVSMLDKNDIKQMSEDEMIYFAKNLLSVELNNMTFMTLPGNAPPPSYAYYVLNRRGVVNKINEYFNIYDEMVTDSIFDKYKVFTSTTDSNHLNIYMSDPMYIPFGEPHSAEDINKDSIDIPRV